MERAITGVVFSQLQQQGWSGDNFLEVALHSQKFGLPHLACLGLALCAAPVAGCDLL